MVGVATAAGASVLWGMGNVATHAVLGTGISVAAFTLIEIGTSIVFLAIVARILRVPWLSIRRHARIGALGILEPGLTYLVMNWGLAHTSVVHASLIGATEPLLIALLAIPGAGIAYVWLERRRAAAARRWANPALLPNLLASAPGWRRMLPAALLLLAATLLVLTLRHPVADEKRRMQAYLVLALGSLVFWSLYQMAPSGLQLFAVSNVWMNVWGVPVAPQWVQNINTVVIVIGGPLLAALCILLAGRAPSRRGAWAWSAGAGLALRLFDAWYGHPAFIVAYSAVLLVQLAYLRPFYRRAVFVLKTRFRALLARKG